MVIVDVPMLSSGPCFKERSTAESVAALPLKEPVMITHTPHRVRALPYIDRFQGSKNSGWKTGGLARSKISKRTL
jgi:hypothetical protein